MNPSEIKSSIDQQKLNQKITNFQLLECKLTFEELKWLISEAIKIIKDQHVVLNLKPPLKIVGDIFGHYKELIKIFQTLRQPSSRNYLFLGNYVGKGPNSLQVLITLLYFKIKYSETFFILRGRFQLAENNYIFGFQQECLRKYDHETWLLANDLFNFLPLGAVVCQRIYCMSSGLSHSVKSIQQMKNIVRGRKASQSKQLIELLNSKPTQKQKTYRNQKNEYWFDEQDVRHWMANNRIQLLIRSNQILQSGFQFKFRQSLLSICSIPNIFKIKNIGAVINISQDFCCSIQLIKSTSCQLLYTFNLQIINLEMIYLTLTKYFQFLQINFKQKISFIIIKRMTRESIIC